MHASRKSFTKKKIRAAFERGRKMAAARWEIEHERRAATAAADPLRAPGRIIRRIVVIDHERDVREAVIYDHDSARGARKKLRDVLSPP